MDESPFQDDNILVEGPSFHVDLAGLDAFHPVHYSNRLLIFRCSSSTQRDAQLAAFKIGLQALVNRCPLLGGIVVPLPPDEAKDGKEDWRTIVPDKGIELVVRDLRKKLPSFEDLEAANFAPSKLPYDLLTTVPPDIGNDRPFAAFKVQFSAIEGGTIITLSISHSVGDGAGTNELTRVLAEETRLSQSSSSSGAKEGLPDAATMLDRSAIRNLPSEKDFNIKEHPAYRWDAPTVDDAPLEKAPLHPFEAPSPETAILLHISPPGLAQLKADATTLHAPHISTHDAIAALIWRSSLLIRRQRSIAAQNLPTSTLGTIFLPSDARRHLKLTESYIGNCVYQLTATLELGELFSPTGLKQAASAIRRAITSVTPAKVSSLLGKTNERWPGWGFMDSYATTGVAMGTDWTSGMLYSQDWGEAFGPLIRYRYPGHEGGGGCCILPKLLNGAAEVTVSVMPQEEDILRSDECFGKYIEKRS
jgi:Trichothecene 3-O-acetyltransferase-like N-terminal domain